MAWLSMKVLLVRVRLPSSSIAPPSAVPLPGPKPSKTMNGFVVPFTEPMAWLPMNVVPLMMAVAGSGPLVAEPPTFSRAPLATRARLLLNTSLVM